MRMTDTFDKLEQLVLSWAEDRNIIKGSDPKSQFLKTVSELGELSDAINKNDMHGQIDGIGDVLVTLIIVAEQLGMTLTECLAVAYMEIKDRKGKLVNGTFIKEEE